MGKFEFWVQRSKKKISLLSSQSLVDQVLVQLAAENDDSQGVTLIEVAAQLRTEVLTNPPARFTTATTEKIVELLLTAEQKLPNDPLPAMNIASHYFYDIGDYQNAYLHAIRAVEKAKLHQDMVRQTVGSLIRICIKLQKHDEIEPLLVLLKEYEPRPQAMEIGLETDFLIHLPDGAVTQAVVDAYKARLGDG